MAQKDVAITIDITGSKKLEAEFKRLGVKLSTSELRGVLRKTATQELIKPLKAASPKRSGTLRKSFGNVTGKNRIVATIFVGPRIEGDRRVRRNVGGGQKMSFKTAGRYNGWLANIIENNKFRQRYPGTDLWGKKKSRPRIPGYGIREHSGIFPVRPYIKRTVLRKMPAAVLNAEAKLLEKLLMKK